MTFIYVFFIVMAIIGGLALCSALVENAFVCEFFDGAKRVVCFIGKAVLSVIMLPAWALWSIAARLSL